MEQALEGQKLGEHKIVVQRFEKLDEIFQQFFTPEFTRLSNRHQFRKVSLVLFDLIQQTKTPCFLLPAVLEYITRINSHKILQELYRFANFELWLNRFSTVSKEENLKIRGKIAGRYIPRDEYQSFFPIGMNTYFPGSHFVAAHISPDVDTAVASFWGWLDAFSARVALSVHWWSLPGSFEDAQMRLLFHDHFGPEIFGELARSIPTLTLTAMDLLSREDFVKVHINTQDSHLNQTNHHDKAIVLVDDFENYVGDWRPSDAENVRQIVLLFSTIMRCFENSIYSHLIHTFSAEKVHIHQVEETISKVLKASVAACDPVREFTEKQKTYLSAYLKKVLKIERGLSSTFQEIAETLIIVTKPEFNSLLSALQMLCDKKLFDTSGILIENRPHILSLLSRVFQLLEEIINAINSYTDRLGVMHEVKTLVLEQSSQFIMLRSDVEEIKSKIEHLGYLTVVVPEGSDRWYPIGIVQKSDLRRFPLGTVSLRDFSNEDETHMASYLEVISIIDHHKTDLKTSQASTCVIADAQSANTLVAERNHAMNIRFSTLGAHDLAIKNELCKLQEGTLLQDARSLRRLQQLAQLQLNQVRQQEYFVDPSREFSEYLFYLHAILDDTDLLSKVSKLDVTVVQNILNRMKSITIGKEVEIISFDDIVYDEEFPKKAARRILQNNDMYSIYKKIYAFKEQQVAANIKACSNHLPSTTFADTKEQNGCCRVGQTKLFQSNFALFTAHAAQLRTIWLNQAHTVYHTKPHIDLHMHMISTITGAEEVYTGSVTHWDHKDEIWIWTPPTQLGIERLIYFLNAFSATPFVQNNSMHVALLGDNWPELQQVFYQNFPNVPCSPTEGASKKIQKKDPYENPPIAILYCNAGSLNSRKAMITPYLPHLIS